MTVRTFVIGMAGLSALLSLGAPAVVAHEMTERFIPIGQSPGLSGRYTVIGKIQTINPGDRTVVIVGAPGTVSAKITEKTKIWVDRSMLRLTNLKGTLADLRPGATVEVKHEDHVRGVSSGPAEWIKVRVPASP
jgi:hypothetical protein